jgi:hypothetical protein
MAKQRKSRPSSKTLSNYATTRSESEKYTPYFSPEFMNTPSGRGVSHQGSITREDLEAYDRWKSGETDEMPQGLIMSSEDAPVQARKALDENRYVKSVDFGINNSADAPDAVIDGQEIFNHGKGSTGLVPYNMREYDPKKLQGLGREEYIKPPEELAINPVPEEDDVAALGTPKLPRRKRANSKQKTLKRRNRGGASHKFQQDW